MSDLLRSAMSARLAKLPMDLPPLTADEEAELEDEESDDALGALPGGGYSGLGPPAIPRQVGSNRDTKSKPKPPNPDFAPISGASYFSEALQVAVPARQLDCRVYYTPPKKANGTVLVCHHGAGYGGLSFACLAKELVGMSRGEVGVLSADARRHGKTKSTTETEDEDLSIGVLVEDFVQTLRAVWSDAGAAPTLLLVGHSMGGSVVTRSVTPLLDAGYRVSGVAVLDVVEGTAIDALPHMHSLLNARPDGFDSVEAAVEWHVKTKTIRNALSARVSVPGIVVPSSSASTPSGSSATESSTTAPTGTGGTGSPHAYVWRTPLRSTAAYWQGWFTGLSASFLSARTARLLLLAGTDRLDRELMIGQMQGKFQMVVVPGVGHVLHEDDPTHVAEVLLEFYRRNDRLRMPAKVKGVGEA
ncbi:Protein phosphatase methylesterase 1 [Mycena venus]|uniref:Protein phosphatase methylesterase 1 n=1 Tax=Mycena venus TaxID=2733690 RepID=A0A8H6X6K2_9AGAR|nr:Protein phosphatase methylesterase 1 [Mycena venus]